MLKGTILASVGFLNSGCVGSRIRKKQLCGRYNKVSCFGTRLLEMDIDDCVCFFFFKKKKKKKKKKSLCTQNFELCHQTLNVLHYGHTINNFFPSLFCNILYRYIMTKLCTWLGLILVSIILDFENLLSRTTQKSNFVIKLCYLAPHK